jgi:osmotically-inducible protein OsmY
MSPAPEPGDPPPANDAMLVQFVRGSLGRRRFGGLSRINISSCKSVVTLHGSVPGREEALAAENAVRRVPGVRGVENKLRVRAIPVR